MHHKPTVHLLRKDVETAIFYCIGTMFVVRDDIFAQISEELWLIKDPSSGQIADVLFYVNTTEIQCGEFAGRHMTQSLSTVVLVDDQGKIEESRMPDLVQVTLEM